MRVRDKVIVVTGGGSGIGRALVLLLLTKGARVAAVDLNPTTLAETVQLAGAAASRLSTHIVNVADRAAVMALPAQVLAAHGVVDGIINNAGIIQPFVRVKDLDEATIDQVMNVNFYGTVFMTKAFLPTLLARPEAHIVNISSMGGFLPVPGQTIYGAAKAAVKLFTEGLYAELRDTSVRVTVVFPGAVSTNIVSNSGLPTMPVTNGKQGSSIKPLPADQAAQMIIDGMERNQFRVLVGNDAQMMDRIYRLSPRLAVNLILQRMKSLLDRS